MVIVHAVPTVLACLDDVLFVELLPLPIELYIHQFKRIQLDFFWEVLTSLRRASGVV